MAAIWYSSVTIYDMWQTSWCPHIWYMTVYMVSPYIVSDRLHTVTIHGMWQTTRCHHIRYVTDYMLSPYMVCDSLHGFTLYCMWQTTCCHHVYVTDYMMSPYMVCDNWHGVTIHGMWETTCCHHIRYVTDYMLSPYMVCDSLRAVTKYSMWQSTWCHPIRYVTDYTLSPHNGNCHCWLLLNIHTLLEILFLQTLHISFCIFTCRRYLYVFKLNSTSKTRLCIISLEIRSSHFSRSGVCSWSGILSKWLLYVLWFDVIHYLQHEPQWSLLIVFIWDHTHNKWATVFVLHH